MKYTSKRRSLDFRLTSVAQKRLCLSSLLSLTLRSLTWYYAKRQTAKMTSEFVFFSSNPSLNHIKIEKCLLLIATNKYFHSTVQRAKERRQKFHFCRLPFDVRPHNVQLKSLNIGRSVTPAVTREIKFSMPLLYYIHVTKHLMAVPLERQLTLSLKNLNVSEAEKITLNVSLRTS